MRSKFMFLFSQVFLKDLQLGYVVCGGVTQITFKIHGRFGTRFD